jgi:hypothetical protein
MISGILFPPALLSFTLLLFGFLRRRVEEWEKVRRTGVFSPISGISGVQKQMALQGGV